MKHNTYDIYYDEESDFLEVFFGERSKCYTEESESGIFVRRDEKTKEIKSVGIVGFKKRTGALAKILQKLNLRLPITISV